MNNQKTTDPKGIWAVTGAVVVAVISSACCWLPLLLVSFGISGGVAAAKFESWRPVMLPATLILLSLGWYYLLKPLRASAAGKDSCEFPVNRAESCCPPKKAGVSVFKFNLVLLGIATVLAVTFVFFPNYVSTLTSGNQPVNNMEDAETVWLGIEGMTCSGCEVHVTKSLETIEGVVVTNIDHTSGRAEAYVPVGTDPDLLRDTLTKAGYKLKDVKPGVRNP